MMSSGARRYWGRASPRRGDKAGYSGEGPKGPKMTWRGLRAPFSRLRAGLTASLNPGSYDVYRFSAVCENRGCPSHVFLSPCEVEASGVGRILRLGRRNEEGQGNLSDACRGARAGRISNRAQRKELLGSLATVM
jgi:hypothetical protein